MKIITCLLLAFSFHGNAQVVKMKAGMSHRISTGFIGVNGNVTGQNMPWDNQKLLSAFDTLNATSIRYPAGTIANYWDWDLGWIDPNVPDSLMIKWVVQQGLNRSQSRYPVENFAKAIKESGATPVFVLNMLTKDLDHSIRGLKKAREAGLAVQYVELGNELYFNLPLEMSVFPTPEKYGEVCFEWIAALKSEFPGVKCGVVSWEVVRAERHREWTTRVLSRATNADAVIFHVYTNFGIDGGRELQDVQPGREGISVGSTLSTNLMDRQREELAIIQTKEGFSKFILTAYGAAQRHTQMQVPEAKEIWATEFNARADSSAIRGTWAQTLFTSAFYLNFLKNQSVTLTHYHNIVGPAFGALYNSPENAFSHLAEKRASAIPWSLTAGGLAVNLFALATKGQNTAMEIQLTGGGVLQSDARTLPELHGWVFSGAGKSSALFINFGDKPRYVMNTLELAGKVSQYSTSVATYVINVESIVRRFSELPSKLELPAYSITVVHQ